LGLWHKLVFRSGGYNAIKMTW